MLYFITSFWFFVTVLQETCFYQIDHDFRALCSLLRLEYKYSRLVMSANKECELPAADSCGLTEGEEPDDDVVYAQKPSLLGKLRAIATKVLRRRVSEQISAPDEGLTCSSFLCQHEDRESSESVQLNSQSDRWALG